MGSSSDSHEDDLPFKVDEGNEAERRDPAVGALSAHTSPSVPGSETGIDHHDLPTLRPTPPQQDEIEKILAELRGGLPSEEAIALQVDLVLMEGMEGEENIDGNGGYQSPVDMDLDELFRSLDASPAELAPTIASSPDSGDEHEKPFESPASDEEEMKLQEIKNLVQACTELYMSFCDVNFNSLKAEAGFFQSMHRLTEREMYELMFAVIRRFTGFMKHFLIDKKLNVLVDKLCYVADMKIDHVANVDRSGNTILVQPGMIDYFRHIQSIVENAQFTPPPETRFSDFVDMIDMNAL